MNYSVEFSSAKVVKQFSCLQKKLRDKVQESISSLKQNPRPSGIVQIDKDIYRMRIGRYRVIYIVYDSLGRIVILKIVKRSESTYKEFN